MLRKSVIKSWMFLLVCLLSVIVAQSSAVGAQQKKAQPAATPKAAPSASAQAKEASPAKEAVPTWKDGLSAMSSIQAMLEYYYLEAGLYPLSLEHLEAGFNNGLPAEVHKVVIPRDPLSGLPFLYTPTPDRLTYTLEAPIPAKYGANLVKLKQLDWAWMGEATRQRRLERMALECTRNIDALATRCELYAKDHEKHFPTSLDALRPRYMPRPLMCPACGMPYIYATEEKGYSISCPAPLEHGLKFFRYSSENGLQAEDINGHMMNVPRPEPVVKQATPAPADKQADNASAPAPADKPADNAPAPAPADKPADNASAPASADKPADSAPAPADKPAESAPASSGTGSTNI